VGLDRKVNAVEVVVGRHCDRQKWFGHCFPARKRDTLILQGVSLGATNLRGPDRQYQDQGSW
jgi:hypothetical protein